MEDVDALADQLEEHEIEETGVSHLAAVRDFKKRGVFFLVTSGSSGPATNRTGFRKLPKIGLATGGNIFTFKIYGGTFLRFKAEVEFKNTKMWGRGTTPTEKRVMRLAYARLATFSSAVSASPVSSSHKRITMSVEFAQILAPMYRKLIKVIKHVTQWERGATKKFLKMFPNAYEKLAWHLMDKALRKCGHSMGRFVPVR